MMGINVAVLLASIPLVSWLMTIVVDRQSKKEKVMLNTDRAHP
jgi:hypothetical protein